MSLVDGKIFLKNQKGPAFFLAAKGACFAALFCVLFASCRTTKFVDERTQIMADGLEINASDNAFKIYDAGLKKEDGDDGQFLFLRVYLPNYDNESSSVNVLKKLITYVDPNPEEASHSSIGFSLDDDFYGLTLYSTSDLKKESCLAPESNQYMKLCNPYTSTQTTLALKVTDEEFKKVKDMVEKDFAEQKVKYWVVKNLTVGFDSVKRKKLPWSKARLGGRDLKKGYIKSSKKQKHFVCSTYLAYVLQSCIKKVDDFFKERNVAYDTVSPTDLYYIPGIKVLFTSTWVDYKIAAQEFVRAAPLFSKYLTD